jgi:U3 small nucleolar RNA-associated protein 19
MPFLEMETAAAKKRKRADGAHEKKLKPRKISHSRIEDAESQEAQVLRLEAQILESRQHYNNIVTLLTFAKSDQETSQIAAVCLCRIFSRLLAGGNMAKSKGQSESEGVIIQWLWERLNEYLDLLLGNLSSDAFEEALTMSMVLAKEEINQRGPSAWEKGLFSRVIHGVLESGRKVLWQEFQSKYFEKYDDVRFYTLDTIPYVPHRNLKNTAH